MVIDTESRGVSPEEAAEAVTLACAEVNFDDYKYVIKKVDSTLRGNIAAEVAAMDAAISRSSSFSCPRCPRWAAPPKTASTA